MRRIYKCLTIVICLLVVFVVSCSSAFAANNTSELIKKTDLRIQQSIDTGVRIAGTAVTNQSNLSLLLDGTKGADTVKNAFTNIIDRTINNLITLTNRFAAHSIDMAAKNGDTVISEYIEVNIGGQLVLVDPVKSY